MMQHCTVILGSGSPRRKELLTSWGVELEVKVPFEKPLRCAGSPAEKVVAIAQAKMQSLDTLCQGVCITADTIVHIEGEVFGKPDSSAHAKEMLQYLSGKKHVVSTAYVIRGIREVVGVAHTEVWMKEIPEGWIDAYMKQAEFMDKAGAYAIQDHAGIFVRQTKGSLTNVIGLPMFEVLEDLVALGVLTL